MEAGELESAASFGREVSSGVATEFWITGCVAAGPGIDAFDWVLGTLEENGAEVLCIAFVGCMTYHAPPATAKAAAAIAPIHTPLLEPPDGRSVEVTSSSSGSKLPMPGNSISGAFSTSAVGSGSAGDSSAAAISTACLAFSRSISSCVDAGAAALRASGSSHDGIFTSSVSKKETVGEGASLAAGAALGAAGSGFAISKSFAATPEALVES